MEGEKVKWKVNLSLLLLLLIFLLASSQQSDILVYFFALPDGEATLIKDENNQFTLINTGSSKSREYLDDKLRKLAVKKLNYLIITEQDVRYRENKNWLLETYQIDHVYDVQTPADERTDHLFIEGTQIDLSDLLTIHGLSTDTDQPSTTSILTYFDHAILLLGQTALTSEQFQLVKYYRADIIKTAHFGIEFTPDHAFWKELNPHAAIFFSMTDDLPDPYFMTYLDENWIDVYRLSDVGSITIRFADFEYDLDV